MIKGEAETRTYLSGVVVEPDEDRWHAYCPALEDIGGATWGYTREEALKNIREVVEMIIEELIEDGEHIPEALENEVRILSEPRVMVTA
jgi:predicted RNase H-like HicB family nuclease